MKRTITVIAALVSLMTAGIAPSSATVANDVGLGGLLGKLPIIRGDVVSEHMLDGQVVLVAFFASWCPPCKHEFPHLNTIQKAYAGDGFQVVAVNVFETHDGLSTSTKLEAFLDDVAPIFPILIGDDEARRVFGNLDRIPTMFLFDRNGAPSFVFRHERNAKKTHLTEEELRRAIEPLL